MPTKQENGPLADKGLVEEIERLPVRTQVHDLGTETQRDGEQTVVVSIALRDRILAALSAQPAGDATDGEGALKAIDLAETISGRGDDKLVSLTPHGWEYIYSAFDACRAALAPRTSQANEGEIERLRALVKRAEEFANNAPQFDWNQDRCIMTAVHLAGDCRQALSPSPDDEGEVL